MTLPDGQSNKGRVQAFDGPIYIADAALYLKAHQPELGIEDPYELNEEQYKAALDLLRVQRTLVSRYWHDAFIRSEEHTSELQSLMRISYAVFCLKKTKSNKVQQQIELQHVHTTLIISRQQHSQLDTSYL